MTVWVLGETIQNYLCIKKLKFLFTNKSSEKKVSKTVVHLSRFYLSVVKDNVFGVERRNVDKYKIVFKAVSFCARIVLRRLIVNEQKFKFREVERHLKKESYHYCADTG